MNNIESILMTVGVWTAGPFAVASILMVVFTTKFAQHVLITGRKLGIRAADTDYWTFFDPALDYTEMVGNLTRKDFETWLWDKFSIRHPKWAELLTCPGCFSMQCGLWLGLVASIYLGNFWFWPLAFLTWPSMGRLVFKKI